MLNNVGKVSSRTLMIIAGFVWLIAGVNVFAMGIGAYLNQQGWITVVLMGGTLVIFIAFHLFVFRKMVHKHTERITSYQGTKTAFIKFLDKRGYLIMACMMGGGILLRATGVVPNWFIAFFYTGLGAALAIAGVSFLRRAYLHAHAH